MSKGGVNDHRRYLFDKHVELMKMEDELNAIGKVGNGHMKRNVKFFW